MPVELAVVAVLNRPDEVNVPLTKLNTPVAPLTAPTWLSCVAPLAVVVTRFGALTLSPKLKTPLFTEKIQGAVIEAEESLSTSVQLAVLLFSNSTLVPPGLLTLFNIFLMAPVPDKVTVVPPDAPKVLVSPPATSSALLAPLSAMLPPKL